MSREYDNTNTGAIFVNHRKKEDKHPDRTGKINVEGKEYYIDGWIKTIKKGDKAGQQFLSVSIKPVDGGSGGGGSDDLPDF